MRVSKIDKVTVVDNGNEQGDGSTRMSKLPETLKVVSGFDIKGMLDNIGTKNVATTDIKKREYSEIKE